MGDGLSAQAWLKFLAVMDRGSKFELLTVMARLDPTVRMMKYASNFSAMQQKEFLHSQLSGHAHISI